METFTKVAGKLPMSSTRFFKSFRGSLEMIPDTVKFISPSLVIEGSRTVPQKMVKRRPPHITHS